MSEHDKFLFCGQICKAARIMGIVMREEDGKESGYAFSFFDPVGKHIHGEAGADRKEAIYNACLALQDYLCIKN